MLVNTVIWKSQLHTFKPFKTAGVINNDLTCLELVQYVNKA